MRYNSVDCQICFLALGYDEVEVPGLGVILGYRRDIADHLEPGDAWFEGEGRAVGVGEGEDRIHRGTAPLHLVHLTITESIGGSGATQ